MLLIFMAAICWLAAERGCKSRDAGGSRPGKWFLLHEVATLLGESTLCGSEPAS